MRAQVQSRQEKKGKSNKGKMNINASLHLSSFIVHPPHPTDCTPVLLMSDCQLARKSAIRNACKTAAVLASILSSMLQYLQDKLVITARQTQLCKKEKRECPLRGHLACPKVKMLSNKALCTGSLLSSRKGNAGPRNHTQEQVHDGPR